MSEQVFDPSQSCDLCDWVYQGRGCEDPDAATLAVSWHSATSHGTEVPGEPPPDAGWELDPIRERGHVAPMKVAIVGYTSSRRFAPYDLSTRAGGDWELWGINNLHTFADVNTDKFGRWFDLHHATDIKGTPERSDQIHNKWLQDGSDGLPTYTFFPDQAAWPNALHFPAQQLLDFGFRRYFTNSISWMVALAITELAWAAPFGGAELAIYGIDMAVGGDGNAEYSHQRPSCEYFIGLAEANGIKVHIPEESDLLKCGALYGFERSPLTSKVQEKLLELRTHRQNLVQQQAQLQHQLGQIDANLHANNGAMQAYGYLEGAWLTPGNRGNSTHESEDVIAAQQVSPTQHE